MHQTYQQLLSLVWVPIANFHRQTDLLCCSKGEQHGTSARLACLILSLSNPGGEKAAAQPWGAAARKEREKLKRRRKDKRNHKHSEPSEMQTVLHVVQRSSAAPSLQRGLLQHGAD